MGVMKMKLEINKKVVAALLAGSMAVSLSGCAHKSSEYKDPSEITPVEYADDYDEPYYEEEQQEIYDNYPNKTDDLRTNEEQANNEQVNYNEINNEQAKQENNINLVITNIPENAIISLWDETTKELNKS